MRAVTNSAVTRTVIVTGASRGLGLGIARQLAGAGYQIVAIARSQTPALTQAIQEVVASGKGALHFCAFDLSKTEELAQLVRSLRKEFGSVYGLVNNAGLGTSGLLATLRESQIAELLNLNTLSPIILSKYVVRNMMADGGGRIVNVASIVAFTGYSGLSVYSATKASLLGFSRSLAREVGQLGINVNAIAPGFIDTEMTHDLGGVQRDQIVRRSALRRLADIEDVANAVEYLLSDKAKNITGTVMTIDAGGTA